MCHTCVSAKHFALVFLRTTGGRNPFNELAYREPRSDLQTRFGDRLLVLGIALGLFLPCSILTRSPGSFDLSIGFLDEASCVAGVLARYFAPR